MVVDLQDVVSSGWQLGGALRKELQEACPTHFVLQLITIKIHL